MGWLKNGKIQKPVGLIIMNKQKKPKFEEAISELETLVSKLEAGDLSLDDSMALFEKGMELVRFAEQKINEAEAKVEVIVKDSKTGELKKEPLSDA